MTPNSIQIQTRWCGRLLRHLSADAVSSSRCTVPPTVSFVYHLLRRPPWTVFPEMTGSSALPTNRSPFPATLGRLQPRQHWCCRRFSHWPLFWAQSQYLAPHVHWSVVLPQAIKPQDEIVRYIGDEHSNPQSGPRASFTTTIVSPGAVCKTNGRLNFLSGCPETCLGWRWSRTLQCQWSLSMACPVSSLPHSGCPRSL
jgi:hypothetical protein